MRRLLPCLFPVLLVACAQPPTLVSGDSRLVLEDGTLVLRHAGAERLRLDAAAFQAGVVDAIDPAASYDPFWLETDDVLAPAPPPDLEFLAGSDLSLVRSGNDGWRVSVALGGASGEVEVDARPNGAGRFLLSMKARVEGREVVYVRLVPRASATEGFYGLGEWADEVNHRGRLRPMQMEPNLALEGSSDENHAPVPLLVGTRGWGLFVESDRPGLFDVARKADDLVEVTYSVAGDAGAGLLFHLFADAHPLDVTRHYHAVTGAPRLPAEWALGPWIWRDENRDQAEVEEDVRTIRALDLATSGLWIDRPYASAVNSFDFDPARFPDPEAMVARLQAAGLRVALWHTPYLEQRTGELHREATERGFFPPKTGLLLNHWGKPIDFTNREAVDWWTSLLERYRALGIEGYKLDYGEDVLVGFAGSRGGWLFSDGSTETTMHHRYQLLYHSTYSRMLPETGGFLLTRTARWGDQVNGIVLWPGDLDANFARHGERLVDRNGKPYGAVGGLPASVVQALSLGPSGFAFYGSDTGGYRHSPPDREVFIRWFQQTALSTVMQVGNSASVAPWEFDDETTALYRDYARLHLRLFPYAWTYARRLVTDGRAIMRPLGLAHPELGVHPSDTYLFGDDLFVAPVVERGQTLKHALFPPGRWVDWWTGEIRDGAREHALPAPLGVLPLSQRAGSVVPMLRPSIDTLAPATDADVDSYANAPGSLWFRVAPGGDGECVVFDGARASYDGRTRSLRFSAGTRFDASAVFELVGTPRPERVTVDGEALPLLDSVDALAAAPRGWTWTAETGGTVWLKASGAAWEARVE